MSFLRSVCVNVGSLRNAMAIVVFCDAESQRSGITAFSKQVCRRIAPPTGKTRGDVGFWVGGRAATDSTPHAHAQLFFILAVVSNARWLGVKPALIQDK